MFYWVTFNKITQAAFLVMEFGFLSMTKKRKSPILQLRNPVTWSGREGGEREKQRERECVCVYKGEC
jgi:hypothetical protein